MLIRHAAAVLIFFACSELPCFAQGGRGSFPTVIGATGQPYGPTQAEYQYQLRYGRPSPGNTGGGLGYVNGYPGGSIGGGGHWHGGYSPYFFMDIGPYVAPPSSGYVFYPSTAYYGNFGTTNYGFPYYNQPFMGTASPQIMQPLDPLANGTFGNGGLGNGVFGNGSATITHFPSINNQGGAANPIVQPSSPKAVESSFEFQTQGDLQLQQINYMAASERYRKAIEAARDRADPRIRMAITLAARSRYLEAVDQLKLACQIDPTSPQHSISLSELFGERNTFEKTRVKQRVAEWTLQDARDPNRLFLLGALLYLDGDPNAKTMIETAILIAGNQEHLVAFTGPRAEQAAPVQAPQVNPQNQNNMPAPPLPNPPAGNQPAQPTPATPKQTAPPGGLPIPAIPPLPEGDPASKTPAVDANPLPAPESDDLNGPTLPPLP